MVRRPARDRPADRHPPAHRVRRELNTPGRTHPQPAAPLNVFQLRRWYFSERYGAAITGVGRSACRVRFGCGDVRSACSSQAITNRAATAEPCRFQEMRPDDILDADFQLPDPQRAAGLVHEHLQLTPAAEAALLAAIDAGLYAPRALSGRSRNTKRFRRFRPGSPKRWRASRQNCQRRTRPSAASLRYFEALVADLTDQDPPRPEDEADELRAFHRAARVVSRASSSAGGGALSGSSTSPDSSATTTRSGTRSATASSSASPACCANKCVRTT